MNLLGREDAWDNLMRVSSFQVAAELQEIALVKGEKEWFKKYLTLIYYQFSSHLTLIYHNPNEVMRLPGMLRGER